MNSRPSARQAQPNAKSASRTSKLTAPTPGAKAKAGARAIEAPRRVAGVPRVATAESGARRKTRDQATRQPASQLIDQRIRELGDWRGTTLARMRALILEADPEVIEEWKWMGTPVWSRDGIICTGETYKNVVKLTFARGARLPDPSRLFNSSLEGNTRRAIDIREGETVDADAFKALVRAAAVQNGSPTTKARPRG